MPIVFIHGVATRDDFPSNQIEAFLRRFIAPEITSDHENVTIIPVYWGDVGVRFAWNGASRPRTPLLGMGGETDSSSLEQAIASAELQRVLSDLASIGATSLIKGSLVAGESGGVHACATATLRLKDLTPLQLSDLVVTVIQTRLNNPEERTQASFAVDAVAYEPDIFHQFAGCKDLDAELVLLESLIVQRLSKESSGLAGMGTPTWLQDMGDRVGEALSRGVSLSGSAVSRVLAEVRKPLNALITLFLGDVFVYLDKRGDASEPGEIPCRLLKALDKARDCQLERNSEPIIVLSHSMGGQIVYDAITHFLPRMPQHTSTRVDFWCATASQVGLFEEMKLFLESNSEYGEGRPVPFPDSKHLGVWWNVWDHNDFISYTARHIFAGVDDQNYGSGMSLLSAHGGYLHRPSFFRIFAAKLRAARSHKWERS